MFLLRDDINEIARILREGGVICYPTDTIWGIGCDATNPAAVARVAALRQLKAGSGMVCLVSDMDMLRSLHASIHPRLETLLSFHTRPLTVLYENVKGLAPEVYGPDRTAALRIAQDEFTRLLLKLLGRPLLATAACVQGEPWPPTFGAISSTILGGVDYVVKYRQDEKVPQEHSPIARLDKHLELEFVRE
ncbi:MAG: Sua5/YciO/YrdC/YwlC family protein [Saprospiraceae bacterium]|nr:Sua5/YciO/YrdC/YwlC family protein [Saprospiraceae bacterium]